MSIRDLFYALGFSGRPPAPTYRYAIAPDLSSWGLYFTLDDEHQVVVTVEQDSLLLGTYEQTIEVQVCGSDRAQCLESYLRYLRNCG